MTIALIIVICSIIVFGVLIYWSYKILAKKNHKQYHAWVWIVTIFYVPSLLMPMGYTILCLISKPEMADNIAIQLYMFALIFLTAILFVIFGISYAVYKKNKTAPPGV